MLLCPKCGRAMEEQEAERVPLELCPGCNGLWLDRTALVHLLGKVAGEDRTTQVQELMNRPASATTDLPCPGCMVHTLVSHRHDGIEIDWCPRCQGVFLDDRELEALASWRRPDRRGRIPARTGSGVDVFDDILWAVLEILPDLLFR